MPDRYSPRTRPRRRSPSGARRRYTPRSTISASRLHSPAPVWIALLGRPPHSRFANRRATAARPHPSSRSPPLPPSTSSFGDLPIENAHPLSRLKLLVRELPLGQRKKLFVRRLRRFQLFEFIQNQRAKKPV